MVDEEKKSDLRLVAYGVIASALVFLVYDVMSSIVEGKPIQEIFAKMFAFPLAVIVGGIAVRLLPKLHSMSNRNASIVFAILGGISIVLFIIFQTGMLSDITIKTDWSSYVGSATITVSGRVNPVVPNEKVSIWIIYPNGETYNSTTISLMDNSNYYEYKFNIKSQSHVVNGVWKVGALYTGQKTFASFEYEDKIFPSLTLSP